MSRRIIREGVPMSHQDPDAERVRLLSICAHATSDVFRSDEVDIGEKVEAAAEFVEVAREAKSLGAFAFC